jgi:hypothetical protein
MRGVPPIPHDGLAATTTFRLSRVGFAFADAIGRRIGSAPSGGAREIGKSQRGSRH